MLRMEMHKAHRPILSLALSTLLLALPAGARAASPVAVSSVRAPGCAPETLNASAVLDGAVTVSPMPGAADASPQTQISFLGVPVGALGAVSVIGSHSGVHTGSSRPTRRVTAAASSRARPSGPGNG